MMTSGVLVGRIVEVRPHPNADHIRLARADLGREEPVQIVVGGPSVVQNGNLVPVASPESRLSPDGKKIRRRRYRGEDSQGMMCNLAELRRDTIAPDDVALLRNVTPGTTPDGLGPMGLLSIVSLTAERQLAQRTTCRPEPFASIPVPLNLSPGGDQK